MAVASSGHFLEVNCAGKCGATDRIPARQVRKPGSSDSNPEYELKPVAAYPYICIKCWMAGCRCVGQEITWVTKTEVDPRSGT